MTKTKTTGKFLSACAALLLSSPAFAAEPVTLSSGEQRVTLLELFTSEGCSSCPPADRWLSRLRDDPRLWTEVVPVALHVDYWDYIGWEDRFAEAEYGERQKNYVRRGAARSAYTPEFFQNGREWGGWFRNPDLKLSEQASGRLDVSIDTDAAAISFSPNTAQNGRLTVSVAMLGMGLETEVRAGENHGRTLKHDFVVLHMQSGSMTPDGNTHTAELQLPELESDATKLAIAVWVTTAGGTEVLQATGGYLPRNTSG